MICRVKYLKLHVLHCNLVLFGNDKKENDVVMGFYEAI